MTTIHTENVQGFDITFSIEPEYIHPRDCFDIEQEAIDGIMNDIDSGRLYWFSAKVTASKNGIELANTYLGACLYQDPMQFVQDNDYYADMVAEVINEAKRAIANLAA